VDTAKFANQKPAWRTLTTRSNLHREPLSMTIFAFAIAYVLRCADHDSSVFWIEVVLISASLIIMINAVQPVIFT